MIICTYYTVICICYIVNSFLLWFGLKLQHLYIFTQESDRLSHYESQLSSHEFSKSPTTSSIHDSSMDVMEQRSGLVSEEEEEEEDGGEGEDGGGGGGGEVIVESSGLTVVTLEGESMVLDSGQVHVGTLYYVMCVVLQVIIA